MPDAPHAEPHADNRDWLDLTQVNSRRAFVLMSMGALTGLALAGFALFTAKGTSTLVVPPEDVALVNQQPISRVDYEAQVRTLFDVDPGRATPAERRKVLQSMIREELFVQRAKELDVASIDPEVRGAMVNSVEQQAAADAITSAPDDAKLTAYYNAHQDKYSSEGTMTVRDVIFPTAAAAAAAVRAIRTRTPLSVAMSNGRDSGKVEGEEFYFAAKIHLGDRLFAAARSLADGAASDPVDLPDGAHVLMMTRNEKPVPLRFAAARESVLADYRADSSARLLGGEESFLRRRANILIAKDVRE